MATHSMAGGVVKLKDDTRGKGRRMDGIDGCLSLPKKAGRGGKEGRGVSHPLGTGNAGRIGEKRGMQREEGKKRRRNKKIQTRG